MAEFKPFYNRASAETKFRPTPDCCYKQTGLAKICQIGPNLSSPFLLTSSGNSNNNQNWVKILFLPMPYLYQFFAAVCQFRLDFENFLINGPADTSETGGGACQDSLTTTTSTSLPVPKICGSNVGHHSMTLI